MGRVNTFLKAWNDNGREVTVGGRGGQSNKVSAWLNSDNAGGESSLTASVEVVGNTDYKTRRKEGDDRKSIFTVELPEPSEHIEVHLVEHHHGLKQLAGIGAALCVVKGLSEGNKPALKFGVETLLQLEAEIGKEVPHIILPGGVSLSHALACVQVVKNMQESNGN